MMKNLVGLRGVPAEVIRGILDSAVEMAEINEREIKKVPTLRGKTVVQLFFEDSTRTRTSFELAGKRLSADVVNLSGKGSSQSKGETLLDTVKNIQAMRPDCIVMRHSVSGAPHFVANHVDVPVINAGDGTNEHPTQALLDMFTIRQRKGRIEGLKIAIVGDILHSRVARSEIYGMTALGAKVTVCGPGSLLPKEMAHLGVTLTTRLEEAIRDADVIMMLRIQRERMGGVFFPNLREYSAEFGLNERRVALAKDDVIILHPGPINRGVEISPEVADGPYSVILAQVTNGVALRMAVLFHLVQMNQAGRQEVQA